MRIFLTILQTSCLLIGAYLFYSVLNHTFLTYSERVAQSSFYTWTINSAYRASFVYWLTSALLTIFVLITTMGGRLSEAIELGVSGRSFFYGVVGSFSPLLILTLLIGSIAGDFPPAMNSTVFFFSRLLSGSSGDPRRLMPVVAVTISAIILVILISLMSFFAFYFYNAVERYETTPEQEPGEEER